MSKRSQQATLSYHIGVRQHIGAPETVVMLHDTDPQFVLSAKVRTGFTSAPRRLCDTRRLFIFASWFVGRITQKVTGGFAGLPLGPLNPLKSLFKHLAPNVPKSQKVVHKVPIYV